MATGGDGATSVGHILWDFDGTLAFHRDGWTGTLLHLLDREAPGHGISRDALSPALAVGFPWHTPNLAHPELADAGVWWDRIECHMVGALGVVGQQQLDRVGIVRKARDHYLDGSHWELFPDTLPCLYKLSSMGWRHIIVSNHVPELPQIVDGLGLTPFMDRVITSANVGYEKPHPEIFAVATSGLPDGERWMVGDNLEADVYGARRCGIRALLVRASSADPGVRSCPNLVDVADTIGAGHAGCVTVGGE